MPKQVLGVIMCGSTPALVDEQCTSIKIMWVT